LLTMGFLACGFQLAFIATHLPAYLLDKGLHPSNAVAALAIIALTNVFGTYCFGLLGARHRRKYLLAGIYLVRTAAMALFLILPVSPWTVYAFAAVMGFIWLGTVPLTSGLVSQVFGVRYITTLFGFVFFGHQLGSFLGVWLGGVVFEMTKSYDLIWIAAMTLGLVAAALHFPIDDCEIRHSPPQRVPA
jgi:MFS family permease